MRGRLIIRPEAEAELAEAFDWYEARLPGLGFEFLKSIDSIFNSINRNPLAYPIVYRTVRRALMRRFPYEIFFVAEPKIVVILAVVGHVPKPILSCKQIRMSTVRGGIESASSMARIVHSDLAHIKKAQSSRLVQIRASISSDLRWGGRTLSWLAMV